jgi:threonine dehydrogenase-like Zn-dependent dehydrogenase
VSIAHIDIPPLEPGAMVVRVDAATLCGTDVHYWQGTELAADRLPYIPGHESAGTIVALEGARYDALGNALRLGERVIFSYPFCGSCFYCAVAGQPTLCGRTVRFGRERADREPYLLGACATHQYVPARSTVVKIPDEVPSPLAASAACALRTAVHAFDRLGPVEPHETILVQGAGPVALYTVALARARGAKRVIVLGGSPDRLSVASQWGADAVIDIEVTTDLAERRSSVLDLTMGRGPDVVVQCATQAAIAEGLDLVRPGGRYVSVGGGSGALIPVSGRALSTKMLQIIGIAGAEARHFFQAIEFLRAERQNFDFELLLSRSYGLDDLTSALHNMASLVDVKSVILPSHSSVQSARG